MDGAFILGQKFLNYLAYLSTTDTQSFQVLSIRSAIASGMLQCVRIQSSVHSHAWKRWFYPNSSFSSTRKCGLPHLSNWPLALGDQGMDKKNYHSSPPI